jgi:hypothetical protein
MELEADDDNVFLIQSIVFVDVDVFLLMKHLIKGTADSGEDTLLVSNVH